MNCEFYFLKLELSQLLLVLLELLIGDTESGRDIGLAQPQDLTTLAHALADVPIDLDIFGPAGFGPSRSSRHLVSPRNRQRNPGRDGGCRGEHAL